MARPVVHQPAASPELIQRLLAAIGTRPPAHADVEAAEYDWRVPRRFGPEQVARLHEFAQVAAERVSAGLTALLRSEIRLCDEGVTEQYGPAGDDPEDALALHLALVRGDAPCGVLTLSAETAVSWLANLLGGAADPRGDVRELSPVDLELLTDVARTIGQELAAAAAAVGGEGFQVGPGITETPPIPPDADGREFCRLSFSLGRPGGDEPAETPEGDDQAPAAEAPPAVTVALDSDVAAELCGGENSAAASDAADAPRRMRRHVDNAVVTGTAVLGSAELSLAEALSLEPGDVVVLDTPADGDAALRVQDRIILTGAPVRSEGARALRVTAMSAAPESQAPPDGAGERSQSHG